MVNAIKRLDKLQESIPRINAELNLSLVKTLANSENVFLGREGAVRLARLLEGELADKYFESRTGRKLDMKEAARYGLGIEDIAQFEREVFESQTGISLADIANNLSDGKYLTPQKVGSMIDQKISKVFAEKRLASELGSMNSEEDFKETAETLNERLRSVGLRSVDYRKLDPQGIGQLYGLVQGRREEQAVIDNLLSRYSLN